MSESRRTALWFLGSAVAFAAIRALFSLSGLLPIWALAPGVFGRVIDAGRLGYVVWLGFGFAATCAACWLAVGRLNAPRDLWFLALAAAIIELASLIPLQSLALAVRGWDQSSWLTAMSEQSSARSAYGSVGLFVVAAFGYVAFAALGCFLGERGRRAVAPRADGALAAD